MDFSRGEEAAAFVKHLRGIETLGYGATGTVKHQPFGKLFRLAAEVKHSAAGKQPVHGSRLAGGASSGGEDVEIRGQGILHCAPLGSTETGLAMTGENLRYGKALPLLDHLVEVYGFEPG